MFVIFLWRDFTSKGMLQILNVFKINKMLFASNKNTKVMSFHYIYGSHRSDNSNGIIP